MACLLQPECNFLHGFFRCKLPVEVVDMELKITSMQGTHIFRSDRATQLVRSTPKKKFRPATPKLATEQLPLPEAPPKLTPSVPARESTPSPGAGKMSGNLFDDRNWLIPQNYLPSKDKEENVMGITSPKPPIKENEPKINEQCSE